ncbi:MAG: cyclic nucleotide-binding domain-containing protein [Acidobacteriota bacterium]
MSFADPRSAMEASPLFANLSTKELDELIAAGYVAEIEPGQVLMREGEVGDSASLMLRGAADVLKKGQDGIDHHWARVNAGEVLGEIGLLLAEERTATVVAREHVQVLTLTRMALDRLLESGSPAARKLLKTVAVTIARRQRDTMKRLVGMLDDASQTTVDMDSLKGDLERALGIEL